MTPSVRQIEGLTVRVDDVIYMPSLEAPSDRPHPFVYFISVRNDSDRTVTIRGRKWIVREKDGETVVVEGEGVVGQNPVLGPGGRFSYNSYHVTRCGGVAEGSYFCQTETGEWVLARIPEFRLEIPAWA